MRWYSFFCSRLPAEQANSLVSFKQAAALGDAQEKERNAQAYIHLDLMPYYQKKYSPVFLSCLASTDHPDTSPFSFVAAIGKDGRVLRLYVDHETNIFACVRQSLQQEEFPRRRCLPITCTFQ